MSMETLRLEEKENDGLGVTGGNVLVALSKAGGQACGGGAGTKLIYEGLDGPLAVGDSSSLVPRVSLQAFDLVGPTRLETFRDPRQEDPALELFCNERRRVQRFRIG